MKKRALGILFAAAIALASAPGVAQAATPPTVSLGSYSSSSSSFASATISGDVNTLTVSVSGAGKIANISGETTKDLNDTSATFRVSSASAAQEKLRSLTFSGITSSSTIEVTADGNTTSELPSGANVTQVGDHYYMWVNEQLSWSAAYNKAKTFKYNGMQGYLATITSDAEYTALRAISTKGSWVGGTIMVHADGTKINDDEKLDQYEGAFTYMSTSSSYNNTKGKAYPDYYWACGPDAGTKPYEQGVNTNAAGEPNAYVHSSYNIPSGVTNVLKMTKYECCLVANNGGTNVINDIIETGWTGDYSSGYFVEFGGYAEGEDPGKADPTLTTAVSYNFAHQHSWVYSVQANKLIATCDATDGVCDLTDRQVALTLTATGKTYDGQPATVSAGTLAEQKAWKAAGLTVPTIEYDYRAPGADEFDTADAPVAAGAYIANITPDQECGVSVRFAITPAEVSLAWSNTEFKYDGKEHAPTCTAGNLVEGDSATVTVSGAAVDAGNHTATATALDNTNYKLPADATKTFTIARSSISPSVSIDGWTYGDEANAPSVSGNPGNGAVTYEYKVKGADDNTYSETVPTDAGYYTVRAVVAESGNYGSGTATCDFTITKAAINPSVSIDDWTYGDTASVPSISGNTGNGAEAFSYKAKGADDSTYSSTVPTAAGDYVVRAVVAESANYKLGATEPCEFTIARREVTVSGITGKEKFYDGTTDVELDCSSAKFDGIVDGDKLTVTATGKLGDKNADPDRGVTISDMQIGGDSVANYRLASEGNQTETTANVWNRPLTIHGLKVKDKEYDGGRTAELDSSSARLEDYVSGDDVHLGAVTGRFEDAAVGTDKRIVISTLEMYGEDAKNYCFARDCLRDPATLTASINQRVVALEWTGTSFSYDGSEHVPTCTVGNLVNGDKITATVSGAQTDAGDHTATATELKGDAASNYKLPADATKAFTIAKAAISPTVTIDGWTYGDEAKVPSVSGNTDNGDVTYEYSKKGEDSWSATVPTAAGDYTVRATVAATDNYQGASATCDFTIAQREVTLDWGYAGFTYDGDEHAPACTAGSLVEGDDVAVTVAGAATDAGDHTATATALSNSNYKLPSDVTCDFTIAKADIEPTVKLEGWTYGAAGNTPTVSGNLGEGKVAFTYYSESGLELKGQPTEAGTYKVVATVAESANYNGAATGSCDFIIAKAAIDPSVKLEGWTYGDKANDPSVSGNPGKGDVAFRYFDADGNELADQPTEAGTYSVVASVAETANYEGATTEPCAFTISKAGITPNVAIDDWTYGDKAAEPVVSGNPGKGKVTYQYKLASAGDDAYTDEVPTDAGSYTVRASVAATKNYGAMTAVAGFTINRKDIAKADVGLGDKLTYNGGEQEQAVKSATVDGMKASYDVSGNAATDAGDYELTLTGTGNFCGTATKKFSVARKDISKAEVELASELTYNGKKQAQAVESVKVDGMDATYSVSDNTAKDAGDYTLTVTGTGNFCGTATKDFSVARKDISKADIELGDSLTCNDKEQEQAVKSVTVDGLEATYEVSGNKVTEAGDYTLTVKGTGNFRGEATKAFTVAPNPDQVAADEVAKIIEGIGDIKYDDASKEAIDEARKAYDELTDEQKKRVDPDTVKKLTDDEDAYKKLDDEVKAAEDAISKIGDIDASTASKEAIEAAKKAYDSLTDEQKAAIDAKYPKAIEKAESEYDEAVAEKKAADEKAQAAKTTSETETTVTVTKSGTKKSAMPATGDNATIAAAAIAAAGTALAALGIAARRRNRA